MTTGTPYCADVLCDGEGAQPQGDQNILGVYFDEAGTISETTVSFGQPVPAYLCLLEATEPSGVSGWECLVECTGDFPVLSWTPRGNAINVLTPPEFAVGLGTPLPWQPTIVLMDILVGVFSAGSSEFYLHPISQPSVPGYMVYAAGDDPGYLIPFSWSSGGEEIPVAILHAEAPPAECSLDPSELAFGDVPVGEEQFQLLTITNSGGQPLSGEVPAACGVFEVVSGAGPFTLQPGEFHEATVGFAPAGQGEYSCSLNLGTEVCAEVPCSGTGYLTYPLCDLCPVPLDFGNVPVGGYQDLILTISNAGGDTLTGVVPVVCEDFLVVSNSGPFSLPAGQSLQVTIRFTPPGLGYYDCTLVIEGICDDVPMSGTGVQGTLSCVVTPDHLNFCTTYPGMTDYQSFTIYNNGDLTLDGCLTETCPAFYIESGGGTFSLDPGEQLDVILAFTPPEPGPFTCTVQTGVPVCGDIVCQGQGQPLFGNPDILGIYFDEDGFLDDLNFPIGEPVTAYLCLRYCSQRSGVSRWECEIEWNEDLPMLAWNLRGQAVNSLRPPEFSVRLASPLPWQESIVLMEMELLLTHLVPCEFYLHPLDGALIPGRPAYLPGNDTRRILPTNWPFGDETYPVAILNPEQPIGNIAPAPRAMNTTAGVVLSWDYDEAAVDGFHVYRRVEGAPSPDRLTSAPVSGAGGHIRYTDPARGIPAGTVLFYCYGLIQNGREARSDEVRITLGGQVPTADVLHPVYPNPFNPATNIRFELRQAGHVRLEVFDLAGRKIRTLVNENLPAAVHERVWDGRNDMGRPASSGAYYCRIETDRFTALQKMLLLK